MIEASRGDQAAFDLVVNRCGHVGSLSFLANVSPEIYKPSMPLRTLTISFRLIHGRPILDMALDRWRIINGIGGDVAPFPWI